MKMTKMTKVMKINPQDGRMAACTSVTTVRRPVPGPATGLVVPNGASSYFREEGTGVGTGMVVAKLSMVGFS